MQPDPTPQPILPPARPLLRGLVSLRAGAAAQAGDAGQGASGHERVLLHTAIALHHGLVHDAWAAIKDLPPCEGDAFAEHVRFGLASRAALHTGDWVLARALAAGWTAHVRTTRDPAQLVRLERLRAHVHLAGHELPAAEKMAQRVVQRSRGLSRTGGTAHGLTLLARVAIERHDYDRAQVVHGAALQAHQSSGQALGVAASEGGLGLCCLGKGMTADAVPYFRRAIHGCATAQAWAAEAAWRAHLDHTLRLLGREALQVEALREHLAVVQRLSNDSYEARLHHTLGQVLRGMGDQAGALQSHRDALAASERARDPAAQAVDHYNIGRLCTALADPVGAKAAYLAVQQLVPGQPLAARAAADLEALRWPDPADATSGAQAAP